MLEAACPTVRAILVPILNVPDNDLTFFNGERTLSKFACVLLKPDLLF